MYVAGEGPSIGTISLLTGTWVGSLQSLPFSVGALTTSSNFLFAGELCALGKSSDKSHAAETSCLRASPLVQTLPSDC